MSFFHLKTSQAVGSISCTQNVSKSLKTIKDLEHLNVFLETHDEDAKIRAQEIEGKINSNTEKSLAGMIISIKDLLCHENHKVTGSSKILKGFTSTFSSTAVDRLLKNDGIIIGRTNCDEFGMGSSNENSAYGPTFNGLNTKKVPGGSSGASAVSVQMDMAHVSLGTDTGGSVRQPAAFCGIYGLKPTYSRISRHGLLAYASSFDTIGIFSKSLEDNAAVLQAISGSDEFDSTVSSRPVPDYLKEMTEIKSQYKLTYFPSMIESEGIAPDVKENFLKKIELLKKEGHIVEPSEFEFSDYLLPTYYILTTAEASSNLSRYDGMRYGHRSSKADDILSLYKKSRSEGFGKEVKRRIFLGTFVLSASYYDAYYTKAQKVRRLLRDYTLNLFKSYDFIISPTTPTTAFNVGENTADPIQMYLADLYTVHASVTGIPAISVPSGFGNDDMPIGFQIMGNDFEEGKIYAFSKYLQKLEKI